MPDFQPIRPSTPPNPPPQKPWTRPSPARLRPSAHSHRNPRATDSLSLTGTACVAPSALLPLVERPLTLAPCCLCPGSSSRFTTALRHLLPHRPRQHLLSRSCTSGCLGCPGSTVPVQSDQSSHPPEPLSPSIHLCTTSFASPISLFEHPGPLLAVCWGPPGSGIVFTGGADRKVRSYVRSTLWLGSSLHRLTRAVT